MVGLMWLQSADRRAHRLGFGRRACVRARRQSFKTGTFTRRQCRTWSVFEVVMGVEAVWFERAFERRRRTRDPFRFAAVHAFHRPHRRERRIAARMAAICVACNQPEVVSGRR